MINGERSIQVAMIRKQHRYSLLARFISHNGRDSEPGRRSDLLQAVELKHGHWHSLDQALV